MRAFNLFLGAVIFLMIFTGCDKGEPSITLESEMLELRFDRTGTLKRMRDKESGLGDLDQEAKAPLMSVRIDGEYEDPISLETVGDQLILQYPSGITAGGCRVLPPHPCHKHNKGSLLQQFRGKAGA